MRNRNHHSSAAQDDAEDEVIGSANDRSIVGSLSNADVASQRHPQAPTISTPGDYSSQEPSGEGLYASEENSHAAAPGRPSAGENRFNSGSSQTSGLSGDSTEEPAFSCCCGQPMRKSSSRGRSPSREMA